MKKVIQFVLGLMVLFFLYQFIVTFFINKHEITYTLTVNNKTYQVNETFLKEGKNHYYNFQLFDEKKNAFNFYYNMNYNKQKKILKDINVYTEGDTTCMLPIFKNDKVGGAVCRYQGEIVSYDYLKSLGITLEGWQSVLQEKGYQKEEGDAITVDDKVTVYNHFPTNYKASLWNYHGLYIVDHDSVKDIRVLDEDNYENTHGILVGDQYIIANTDEQFEFNRIYLINIAGPSEDFIDISSMISKDSYFLGSVNDQLYIMDRDKKIEYSFNVKNKKLTEVGNKEKNAQMYNGKWYEENIHEVSDQKRTFSEPTISAELEELYHPKWVHESPNKFYFGTEDGKIYYVVKEQLKNKVLLLQNKNLKELKIIGDDLFFVVGSDVIHYNLMTGYHKIMTYSELAYHSKNMFEVVEK